MYYLKIKIQGKRVKRSLRTRSKAEAREILPDMIRQVKAELSQPSVLDVAPARGTWSGILGEWLQLQRRRPDLQEKTKRYYENMVSYALEYLEGEQLVRASEREQLERWWASVASRWAESTANNILAAVRGALELAEESGLSFPAGLLTRCKKLKIPSSEMVVPTNGEMEEILMSVESTGRATSEESRDFIEFLAFVGCRIGEARAVTWGDIKRDEILIRGQEDARGKARTKGGDFRRVPIADRIRFLLKRRRPVGARSGDLVFRMKSPKGALNGACQRLALPHMRIHDLRHFFATHCIERGVDIPTVAGWLGHKDGGVLAMKLYGHVRNLHSQEMGKRIG
jgi:integrase